MAPLVDPREKAEKGLSSLSAPGDRFAYWLSQITSPLVVGLGVLGYALSTASRVPDGLRWLTVISVGLIVPFGCIWWEVKKAKIGADLLDIGGKVNYIGVNSNQDGTTELAAIKNPKQVAQLVAMVLSAPVDQTRVSQGGPQYFLAFHLKDGTVVIRAYWLNSGELARGILLPKAFGSVVAHALSRNHMDFPLQAPFNQG